MKKPSCDFLALAKARRTTYEFSDRKVSDSQIRKILEAARLAPSSHNLQSWSFIIVRNKKTIQDLLSICYYGDFHIGAPSHAIAIIGEPVPANSKALLHGGAKQFMPSHKYLNLSMPTMNMVHQATSMGISSCIVSPLVSAANKILKVPKGREAILLVCIGYEKPGVFRKKQERKSLDKLVFREWYGKR